MAAQFSTFVAHHGSLAIFVLMTLESACIPIPSEAVMPFAGFLAYNQELSFWMAVIVATIANVFGGLIAYVVGRAGGRPLITRYGRYILLSEKHLHRAEDWFARRGEITVFLARLLPAFRTIISLPAGIANMPLGKFILYSILGSLPWNFALTYAGYALGKHWDVVSHYIKPVTYLGAVVIVVVVVWFWFGLRKSQSGNQSV